MEFYNSFEYIKNVTAMTKPLLKYDESEDLTLWQKKAREKIYDLLGLPFEKCDDLFRVVEERQRNTHKEIEFVFQSEKEYFVQGTFCVPNNSEKPLPVVICLLGHASGKHIAIGVPKYPGDECLIESGRDFAVRAVKEGYCSVVIEWRYMGEAGRLEEDGGPICSRRNAALPSLLLGRTAIGERVWDVQRLIDVLEKYFTEYADVTQIMCMGHSGGGTACFYSSCLDERIKASMPSGSFCSFDASIIPIHHCCCNYVPSIRKYFDMGDMAMMIAPRPFIPVCGVEDRDFPIQGVEQSFSEVKKLYRSLGKGDLCQLVRGNAGHRFYPDDAWPVAHRLFDK